LHLLNDGFFLAKLGTWIYFDDNPSARALLDKAGKFLIAQLCGVAFRVGFGKPEDDWLGLREQHGWYQNQQQNQRSFVHSFHLSSLLGVTKDLFTCAEHLLFYYVTGNFLNLCVAI
jgi:hypothetical protein